MTSEDRFDPFTFSPDWIDPGGWVRRDPPQKALPRIAAEGEPSGPVPHRYPAGGIIDRILSWRDLGMPMPRLSERARAA